MIRLMVLLFFLFLILAVIWGTAPLTQLRRIRVKKQLFSSDWTAILERNVPLYKKMPESCRKHLHEHINVLLAEKKFKGCDGLELDDEIKLTIAGQAALLLLNERGNYFSKLKLILVYPSVFLAPQTTPLIGYYLEEKQLKAGESWGNGILVLSWDNIKYDANHGNDGRNVILHEFAHQLDQEAGSASGVPILEKKSDYVNWGQVFRKEYERLHREVERGVKTVIDDYGTTNPAEFFAVTTEAFFEKPLQMKMKHSELYHQLKHYYKIDPAEWIKVVGWVNEV